MQQISFLINCSVNTLDHMKLLIKSLKENLYYKEHEILVFVDSDNEGLADWLREQKKDFYDLKIITHKVTPCIGYSRNNNLLVELAKHDIVSYLQSDMVISPEYDRHILAEVEDNCILSATRIEPPLHGISEQTITKDLGTDPNEFKWDEFQKFAPTQRTTKILEYFFAPFTFYKQVWLEVGGYDTLYRRSREDSDLLQRFVQKGVKIKQTFEANVYHFSCVTSRGKNWFDQNNQEAQTRTQIQQMADIIELKRFIRKWGKFTHEVEKLKRYDIDLVWKNGSIEGLANVEYFFNRVWVADQDTKDSLTSLHNLDHSLANQLLKFTSADWESAKKFYNQTDYDKLYRVGTPEKYNVLVEIDASQDLSQAPRVDMLNDIIDAYEPGTYAAGGFKITINHKRNLAEEQIFVLNPPFDHSLLTIE